MILTFYREGEIHHGTTVRILYRVLAVISHTIRILG